VLRVGCPMWAHASWVGRFLSPANRGRELAEYAGWCNAVEGNTTFYAQPPPGVVARWVEQAPSDFRFAFKLPRTITHEHRLRHAEAPLRSFLGAIEPLGERVGPIQIQLPPSFGPESTDALERFVRTLPSEQRFAVELRHHGFFGDAAMRRRVDDVLDSFDIGRVVLDTRPLYLDAPRTEAAVEERRTKPKLPVHVDVVGAAPIVRVIGSDSVESTLDGLRSWIPQLVSWIGEGREPHVFVHQPENTESPALARRLHTEVAANVPALRALPEPLPVAPAGEVVGQDTLF
jgi:uncharacterized protein YecE (DUF72 family)